MFSDSEENLLDMCVCLNRSMDSLQYPLRGGWTSNRNFLSLDGDPCRLINACGVVTLINGELKWVIGIHVDDFLIGVAESETGEKWMFEIKIFVSLAILENF